MCKQTRANSMVHILLELYIIVLDISGHLYSPVLPWLNLVDGFITWTTFGYNAPTKMAETSFQFVEFIFAYIPKENSKLNNNEKWINTYFVRWNGQFYFPTSIPVTSTTPSDPPLAALSTSLTTTPSFTNPMSDRSSTNCCFMLANICKNVKVIWGFIMTTVIQCLNTS